VVISLFGSNGAATTKQKKRFRDFEAGKLNGWKRALIVTTFS
jgi:hypothetical protein